MATTTSWKSPGTFASVYFIGAIAAWSNPSRAKTSDNSYATAAMSLTGAKTNYYLRCTNFSFAVADVPANSRIMGIEVEVECKASGPYTVSEIIYLRNSTGQKGQNRCLPGGWPTTEAYRLHGSVNDTWGAGLTQKDILSSQFGVDIAVSKGTGGSVTVYVDHVRIRVTYETAPALTSQMIM